MREAQQTPSTLFMLNDRIRNLTTKAHRTRARSRGGGFAGEKREEKKISSIFLLFLPSLFAADQRSDCAFVVKILFLLFRLNKVLKLSGRTDLVTVFTAVSPQFRVFQVEDVRNVRLGRGDAPGVLAYQHIFYPFGEFKFYLVGYLFVFDDIHRNMGIDKAQYVKVDSNGVVNFDDVFAAHVFRRGVYYERYGVMGFVQPQPVKNPDALSRSDMIDDDTVFDLRYIQHS
jgi:hypothetical protein